MTIGKGKALPDDIELITIGKGKSTLPDHDKPPELPLVQARRQFRRFIYRAGKSILLDGYKREGGGILSDGFYTDGVVSDSTTSGVVLIIGAFVNAFVFLYKEIWDISA